MLLGWLLVIVLIINVRVKNILLFVRGAREGVLYPGGLVELHVFLPGNVMFINLFLVSFIIDLINILTVELCLRNH